MCDKSKTRHQTGFRFEKIDFICYFYKHPPLAQLAEQVPLKDKVAGSTPAGRTNAKHLAAMSKCPAALASGVERQSHVPPTIGRRGSEAVASPKRRKPTRGKADSCRADKEIKNQTLRPGF